MPRPNPPSQTLTVLTLNTWNCQGDYRRRLAAMTEGLRACAPDIVLLQEVHSDRAGTDNTARALADALGLKAAYHPARTKTRRLNGEAILCSSGLAVLARHDIVWSERLALPADPRDGERIAQFCEVRIGRERLLLINVHLSHLDFADNLRRAQLAAILDRLNDAWDHDRILLGGDFNATSDNPLFDVLTAYDDLTTTRAALTDGDDIDHLFVLRRKTAGDIAISDARVELEPPNDPDAVAPSDHRAILAHVTLGAVSARPVPESASA